MTIHVVHQLILTAFLAIIAYIGYASYSVWTDGPPMTYSNEPFTPDKEVYHPGDILTFDVTVCAEKDTVVIFTQRFKNVGTDQNYPITSGSVQYDQGCHTLKSIPKPIPEDLEPGRYIMEFAVSVDGRFRHFIVPLRTQRFTIAPR